MNEPRISNTTGALMLIVAVFFDLSGAGINLIPVAGQIFAYLITGLGYLTHWFWFTMKDVSVISSKQVFKTVAKFLGPAALEIITLGVAPGLTLSVLLTIGQSRIEDRAAIAQTKRDTETQQQLDIESASIEESQIEDNFEEDSNTPPQVKAYDDTPPRDTLEE